jgi:hypothetical protein
VTIGGESAGGNFAQVPLIIGSTRHETRTFLPVLDFGMSQKDIRSAYGAHGVLT